MGRTEHDLIANGTSFESGHRNDMIIGPQFQGLNYLQWFLKEGSGFERLQPFQLDIGSRRPVTGRLNPRYQFYLGNLNNRNLYLGFALPLELAEGVRRLNAYPSVLEKGERPYYWLDFYSDDVQEPDRKGKQLTSCRLMPEKEIGKIDFEHWHSIGEQLLADYLMNRNGITFGDLIAFDIMVLKKGTLGSYRVAGERSLALHLGENQRIKDGDILRFTPNQDDQQIYQWEEVTRVVDDTQELVASYRLFPAEKRLTSVGWFGAERQLLVDHILGMDRVKFQNLRTIPATVSENAQTVNLIKSQLTGVDITFNLRNGMFNGGEDVVVVPRQDEQAIYEWLELYRANAESFSLEDECVAAGRLKGKKIIQRGWRGPEIQLFKDYLSGTVNYENLRPISLDVGNSPLIVLWKDKDEIVYLVPSKRLRLSKGDRLVLMPELSSESGIDLLLTKNNEPLCRVNFDIENRIFKLREIFYQAGSSVVEEQASISSDEADEMMRSLLEE